MKRWILFLGLVITWKISAAALPSDIDITPITDQLYLYESWVSHPVFKKISANGVLYVEHNALWVIDTPWNKDLSGKLLTFAEYSGWEVQGVILSHFHEDAAGGVEAFIDAGIDIYLSDKTNEYLGLSAELENIHVLYKFPYSIDSGNNKLTVDYPGPSHSEDNLVVWVENERLLFGSCLIRPLAFSGLGNTNDAHLKTWPAAIETLMKSYPLVEYVVPGHGDVGGPELLLHTLQMFNRQ